MDSEMWINGLSMILSGHVTGDHCHLQIVDVDNIIGYGAGFVFDEFAEDWFIAGSRDDQGLIRSEYPAKIREGLYIRFKYNSTGTEDVKFFSNIFFHKFYGGA